MLQNLLSILFDRGVQAQIVQDHYFVRHGQCLHVGPFTVREARGQLYARIADLGNQAFTEVETAADFLSA